VSEQVYLMRSTSTSPPSAGSGLSSIRRVESERFGVGRGGGDEGAR